jgi:hypothetical protein
MDINLKAELAKGLERIEGLVDEIKVRAHLAGMEAKDEWTRLEPKARQQVEAMKGDLSKASRSAVDEMVSALEKLREKL